MDFKLTAIEAANFLGVTVQAIHKQLKTQKLEFEKSQNRVYFGHKTAQKLFSIPFKKKIITFQIVKGGTGKTSIAHALAINANLYGARVLCIDLDQQGNLTQAFRINPEECPVMIDSIKDNVRLEDAAIKICDGLSVIPSRIENAVLDNVIMLSRYPLDHVYKDKIEPLKEKFDVIIIDCPPAIGQSVAAATLSSDLVISPVTPEKFCLSGLKITNQELCNIEENYHKTIPMSIVLNKFDSRTILSHEVLSSLIKHPVYGEKILRTYIRASQEFPNSIAKNHSIFHTLKITTAKEDIDLLTKEILELKKITEKSENEISLGNLEENKEEVVAI